LAGGPHWQTRPTIVVSSDQSTHNMKCDRFRPFPTISNDFQSILKKLKLITDLPRGGGDNHGRGEKLKLEFEKRAMKAKELSQIKPKNFNSTVDERG